MIQTLPPYLQTAIRACPRPQDLDLPPVISFAPSNIALIKYWGKRDASLNLPLNSSLSISLGNLGTYTTLSLLPATQTQDEIWLAQQLITAESPFAQRIQQFLGLVRNACQQPYYFKVVTHNTVPTAAGLASSASGFAALTLAVNRLLGWQLNLRMLSTLARLGSGSAARSLYSGFVIWYQGEASDGSDSFAEPLFSPWKDLRIGVLTVDHRPKAVDSRSGMANTVQTAALYRQWPTQATDDLRELQQALTRQDFTRLGEIAEHNALSMHATMIASWPPLLYWQPTTVALLHRVWDCRRQGLAVYCTIDAGPNIKLLFQQQQVNDVLTAFPEAQIVNPFIY